MLMKRLMIPFVYLNMEKTRMRRINTSQEILKKLCQLGITDNVIREQMKLEGFDRSRNAIMRMRNGYTNKSFLEVEDQMLLDFMHLRLAFVEKVNKEVS